MVPEILEEIEEEAAPLAAMPVNLPATDSESASDVIIMDPSVPMGNLPHTGTGIDTVGILMVLTLASGLTAAGVSLSLLRKKEQK